MTEGGRVRAVVDGAVGLLDPWLFPGFSRCVPS